MAETKRLEAAGRIPRRQATLGPSLSSARFVPAPGPIASPARKVVRQDCSTWLSAEAATSNGQPVHQYSTWIPETLMTISSPILVDDG
jgi:hypothetical protein